MSRKPKTSRKNAIWTEEELKILRENLNSKIEKLKPLLPNKSERAIRHEWSKNGRTAKYNTLSAEDFSRVIDLYADRKMTIVDVAKKTGLSVPSVHKILNISNTPHKTRKEVRSLFGLTYTEIMPDDETLIGYFCGFLASDGCLVKTDTVVDINLSQKDSEFLKNLVSFFVIEEPKLRLYTYNNNVKFSFRCPNFYQFCLDLGITPRKTHSLDINLKGKSLEFVLGYLRGAIDGDGSIYYGEDCFGQSRLSLITASKKYADSIINIYGGKYYTTRPTNPNHCPLHHIQWTGYLAKALAEILPLNSYMLERKSDRIRKLNEFTPKQTTRYAQIKSNLYSRITDYVQENK